ncbi:unnamed protein product [Orchesella dallaii]|uniref:AH domain-containing protein n=1 Tax=Orchesella dallaii TaxID=48710 RepID=A0ABP1QHU4_9HEXA
MDRSTVNKLQHQYWVTKQTVYRKLGKKDDECIVASDAELDAKLELFKSIRQTSSAMNKLLDRYQERICYLAHEQNAMGRFMKEFGKSDKSAAGKMMIQMGKSLIYCSQQEIGLRPPLLRLYQEVETFRNRAVEDTWETVHHMEKNRTEYRAALNWMKNVSQELDPDMNKQMDKFRNVQTHVKGSKAQFDKLKLACLQKIDLLAAARCNMFSHALIQYQNAMQKITAKNAKIFNTLAVTCQGYQHYEFSVVKELAEPATKLAEETGSKGKELTDQILFDFNDELEDESKVKDNVPKEDSDRNKPSSDMDLLDPTNASQLLENLLGGPMDMSPETESARDALDLGLGLCGSVDGKEKESGGGSSSGAATGSLINVGSFKSQGSKRDKDKDKDGKEKDVMDLLCSEDFESIPFETESDTLLLLNEISSAAPLLSMQTDEPLIPNLENTTPKPSSSILNSLNVLKPSSSTTSSSTFMPSHLLDLGNLNFDTSGELDLLSLSLDTSTPLANAPASQAEHQTPAANTNSNNSVKSWYDLFADLDPIGNPDSINKKSEDGKESDSRYC